MPPDPATCVRHAGVSCVRRGRACVLGTCSVECKCKVAVHTANEKGKPIARWYSHDQIIPRVRRPGRPRPRCNRRGRRPPLPGRRGSASASRRRRRQRPRPGVPHQKDGLFNTFSNAEQSEGGGRGWRWKVEGWAHTLRQQHANTFRMGAAGCLHHVCRPLGRPLRRPHPRRRLDHCTAAAAAAGEKPTSNHTIRTQTPRTTPAPTAKSSKRTRQDLVPEHRHGVKRQHVGHVEQRLHVTGAPAGVRRDGRVVVCGCNQKERKRGRKGGKNAGMKGSPPPTSPAQGVPVDAPSATASGLWTESRNSRPWPASPPSASISLARPLLPSPRPPPRPIKLRKPPAASNLSSTVRLSLWLSEKKSPTCTE